IMIIDEFEYWESFPQDFSDPWFKTLCHEYRYLRKEELPKSAEFGISYKSVSINPQTYLKYLLNTFISMGGTTQHADISHINECIKSETDILINCSGIHARTLKGVEGSNVYAARGQLVIVQSNINWAFFYREKAGNKPEVIPRSGDEVALGGTYQENNYSTDIDHDAATRIIQRCLAVRPDLLPKDQTQLTIKGYGVGLRPCRKGGIRIDAEWITSEEFDKKILICHNYGHGGAWFESSYGTAKHVIKVMKEMLQMH
ncbi:21883_t:CDS:2, partial [Dentiscutata erythropus]